MISILKYLKTCNKLEKKCTIWESTDDCCKEHRCGEALYFLSFIFSNFNITIDRMICAPKHGKYLMDTINARDKQYLISKICMIGKPEA